MADIQSLRKGRDKTPGQTQDMWAGYYASLLANSTDAESAAVNEEIQRYAFKHSWHNAVRIVLERGRLTPGQRVLDVGCGWGRILMGLLNARTGIHFTAMDLIEESILQGQNLFGSESNGNEIEWKQGDAAAMPFDDGQFDVVYSSRVFQHLPDPAAGAREIRRVLKAGGRFVVFHQNQWCPANLAYYSRVYSPRQASKWYAKAGFSEFHVRSMDFVPGIESLPFSFRMDAERFMERVSVVNLFGGKVLAWGVK